MRWPVASPARRHCRALGSRVRRKEEPAVSESTSPLKAGVWFRRVRLVIVSPGSSGTPCQAEIPPIVLSRFPGPPLSCRAEIIAKTSASSPRHSKAFIPPHPADPKGSFQISLAYSWTVRSEENHPTWEVFRMLACHHAAGFCQRQDTSRCLA
jgi:hypothetical protein